MSQKHMLQLINWYNAVKHENKVSDFQSAIAKTVDGRLSIKMQYSTDELRSVLVAI